MNKKEILIILLIICCVFSLQAVSAASDANSTDHVVLTTDSNVSAYSLPDSDNQLVGSENAETFTNLETKLSEGGVITLEKNYTYDSSSDLRLANGIIIPETVTKIDGQGKVIIDGNHLARVFNVLEGHTVTLTGITFINANATKMTTGVAAGHGGSIFAKGVVHIDNCRFIDNTATKGNGGAIFISGTASTITNSYFEGNRAIRNFNNNITGIGGSVFLNASFVNVTNSNFIKNMAGLNAGGIGSSSNRLINITIGNCTLSNNTANGSAGAVGMQSSNFRIYDSIFKYNEARGLCTDFDCYYPGNGGGMVMRGWNSEAYNCTFISNIAKLHGGAAFSTNTSYNPVNNNTGFVLCTFINNSAGHNGGAVDWVAGASYGYVIDCNFTNNTAERSGGALHWSGHYGTVSNSIFIDNTAKGIVHDSIGGFYGGGDGGAIVWIGSNGIMRDNCIFINNTAAGRGGAVYMHGNDTENATNITIQHSTFDSNNAGINGGALDWNEGSHDGNIFYCNFTNNIAKSNGGAVFWSGHHGEIWYSNFTNNTARGLLTDTHGNYGDGGAIIWSGINGTVVDCRFINNSAAMRGGAVFLQNCTHDNCTNTTFDYVYFKNNTAGTNGGAIDWHEGAQDGHLNHAVFEQNTAKRSGGAVYWNGNNGEIKNSNFTNNKALGIAEAKDAFGVLTKGGDGGAVIWIGAEGKVNNSIFKDNEAAQRGGAVYLQSNARENCTNTSFINSKFINNTAGTNGGAVDWHEGATNGLVENIEFINNTAERSGGAIFWNGINGTVKNSNFTNNKALGIKEAKDTYGNMTYGGYGGAIMWTGSMGVVDNCRFISNEAMYNAAQNSGGRGGAVYLQGSNADNCTNTTFKDSIFISNYAGTNGGAVDWHEGASDGNIFNCTFQHNIAESNGGGVYWRGHNGEIIDSNFTNNTARGLHSGTYGNFGDGGAVFWAGVNGTVDNCRFIDNRAQLNNATATDGGNGGAVYLEPCCGGYLHK